MPVPDSARAEAEEEDARNEAEAEETAFIIFTSGTTSKPKAVQISQKALTFDVDAFNGNIDGYGGRGICVAVPLFHILGLLMSYAFLCQGATVCLPANYKPETLVREIDANRVSSMAAVGAVYLALAEAEGFEENVVPHLHLCMIAGGMSTPVQMMRLELQYSNATFINMYGQSEAAPLTMVRPGDLVEQRAQTVGQPIEGLEIRIQDGKGAFLPPGEIGEVVARGTNLMNGYDRLPKDKQPVDENGWLHTGDLGYLDEDGFLRLAGRIKDVIIRGGENISPSEIEQALTRLANIREAKVMGAPHPIYGESVEACVTLTDRDAPFDPEALKNQLRSQIARFKLPSHIFLYDRFPLNVNGKLDQRALRADMLTRLLRLSVDEALAGGVTVFDVVIKNSSYAIVPVSGMVSELAAALGYSRRGIMSIRLAVEEMLTERIMDAYSAAGEIQVRITLMPEWLRVAFSDHGAEYFIDKRKDTSMSAKIILRAVSDFHTDYSEGRPVYSLRVSSGEMMDFVRKNGTSPSVMFSMLMGEAILRVHPEADAPVMVNVPVSRRKMLGCEETFKNCSGRIILPVHGTPMDAMPFAERAAALRGLLKMQMNPNIHRMTYNYLGNLYRQRMENAVSYAEEIKKTAGFMNISHDTFYTDYIGSFHQTEYEGQITDVHFLCNPPMGSVPHMNIIEHDGQFRMEILACCDFTAYAEAMAEAMKGFGLSVTAMPEWSFLTPLTNWRDGMQITA